MFPSPQSPRNRLAGLDALALKALLDAHFTDVDESPYRRLYESVRVAALAQRGPATIEMADALRDLNDGSGVEEATCDAGFVLGFEVCRQLLLGELTLDELRRRP